MQESILKLQNGSDIRGIALDITPNEKVNFTPKIATLIGKAFCQWLSENGHAKTTNPLIGVGMDSRISGPDIKKGLIEGLISGGANVSDYGLATTPAMFMSTQFTETNCDGGIMITASHLPSNRNGLKFFTKKSGLEKKDITRILEIANSNNFTTSTEGKSEKGDIISPYSAYLRNYITTNTANEQPLKGLKIIVDAGNGAGGFFAAEILEKLGADTSGSQFLEPDGHFPNHKPNPEDKDAIESIVAAVIKNNADLGVIFDTDVDRAAVIDKSGNPINRNTLIALLSAIVLKEHPNSYIVTDSVTSDGLADFITALKGKHHRFKRGYKNVINESIRLNKEGKASYLAIETSGHGAFKENFFLDDGAFIVAKILVEVARLNKDGKTISNYTNNLKQAAEERELRIGILDDNFLVYGQQVINDLKTFCEKQEDWTPEAINHEGFRVNYSINNTSGWFLLRLSLHDPVLPLNIESNSAGGIELITEKLKPFFNNYKKLDITCFNNN